MASNGWGGMDPEGDFGESGGGGQGMEDGTGSLGSRVCKID